MCSPYQLLLCGKLFQRSKERREKKMRSTINSSQLTPNPLDAVKANVSIYKNSLVYGCEELREEWKEGEKKQEKKQKKGNGTDMSFFQRGKFDGEKIRNRRGAQKVVWKQQRKRKKKKKSMSNQSNPKEREEDGVCGPSFMVVGSCLGFFFFLDFGFRLVAQFLDLARFGLESTRRQTRQRQEREELGRGKFERRMETTEGENRNEMTAEQTTKLNELEKQLREENLLPAMKYPDSLVLERENLKRYLRGLEWNVEKAKHRVKKTLEWYKTFQPHLISARHIEKHFKQGKNYHNGFDKQGRPVVYMRVRSDPPHSRFFLFLFLSSSFFGPSCLTRTNTKFWTIGGTLPRIIQGN
jgi:hypothetical protein